MRNTRNIWNMNDENDENDMIFCKMICNKDNIDNMNKHKMECKLELH